MNYIRAPRDSSTSLGSAYRSSKFSTDPIRDLTNGRIIATLYSMDTNDLRVTLHLEIHIDAMNL